MSGRVEDLQKVTEILGSMAMGNLVGFFLLIAAIFGLGWIVAALWRIVQTNMEECRRDRENAVTAHQKCEDQNRILAEAVMAATKGHHHEAVTKAGMVLERTHAGPSSPI